MSSPSAPVPVPVCCGGAERCPYHSPLLVSLSKVLESAHSRHVPLGCPRTFTVRCPFLASMTSPLMSEPVMYCPVVWQHPAGVREHPVMMLRLTNEIYESCGVFPKFSQSYNFTVIHWICCNESRGNIECSCFLYSLAKVLQNCFALCSAWESMVYIDWLKCLQALWARV